MSTFRVNITETPEGDKQNDWEFTPTGVVAQPIEGEPELVITIGYKDLQSIGDGKISAPVAYMQGILKSTGDTGILLDLLAQSKSNEFTAWFKTVD